MRGLKISFDTHLPALYLSRISGDYRKHVSEIQPHHKAALEKYGNIHMNTPILLCFWTEILTQYSFTYLIIRQISTVNFRYNLTTHTGNNITLSERFEERSICSYVASILEHENNASPRSVTSY